MLTVYRDIVVDGRGTKPIDPAVVPLMPGDPAASFRRELTAFRRPQVWMVMAMAAIGFDGFFAVYSYIAPVVTEVTGLSESFVPWTLVGVGIGMTVGNFLGGWLSDVDVRRTLYVGFIALIVSLLGFVLTAHTFVGMVFFAALNHSALNLGNSLGAFLGGAAIAAGFGYLSPGWVGLVLAMVGLVVAAVSFAVQRAGERSPVIEAVATEA